MKTRIACALLVAAALAACAREAAAPAAGGAGDGDAYVVRPWEVYAGPGSMAPALALAPGERVLLSWLSRPQGRRPALQFASYTDAGGWQSPPRTIAVGNSLVANWADVPHMLATPDGALWVQWLQANGEAAFAYDTVLARSRDGGVTWSQLTRVNRESGGTYSGFAALWAQSADRLGIAWLDGAGARGHAEGAAHAGDHHGDGDMQLRANVFDMSLERGADAVVDLRTCDCCQTDVALTARGPLLAYRDRDAGELRDIKVARFEGGAWRAPVAVHADGWKTEACPVNGPAIAARDAVALVAWYSEGGGEAAVRIARSSDAGEAFAPPVVVDRGTAVLGRVDVGYDGEQAWVAWLREEADGQRLMLARYAPDLSRQLQRIEVARLAGRGRATGVPALAVDDGGAWLAWTDVVDGVPGVRGARVAR